MSEGPTTAHESTFPSRALELWRVVLAGLSIALGSTSCFYIFGFDAGIIAIFLGVLAFSKLPRPGRLVRGVAMAKVGIALGSIGIIQTLILSQPHGGSHPVCQNNLKQIGVCLEMYAGENKGALPDKLSMMYPEYITDPEIFVCPQSGNKSGDPARIDEWSDYTYVHGLRKTGTTVDADALICYECEYRHTPRGRNELYLDGHVEFRELGKLRQPLKSAQP